MASGLENEYVTLHEIVKAARLRLNANIWDYLIGGTETETTLRRNRMALDSIVFKPRVLRNVRAIDPSSEIFGKKLRIPVLLAPVGSLESFEPGGGITVAKGAGAKSEPEPVAAPVVPAAPKRKLSYKDARELEQLPLKIEQLETRLAELTAQMNQPAFYQRDAAAINAQSDRSDRNLVRVNCAAIPENLFESEFFGHRRGSFTSAVADRTGRFAEAEGGT